MSFMIENEQVIARFNPIGGELTSLVSKVTEIEYLWQGDPEFWGRQSPVLFPIVGRLRNDRYTYKGTTYPMSQHGFARDQEFTLKNQTSDSIAFSLKSSLETKTVYPFDFELVLTYRLVGNQLLCGYEVTNVGTSELYFSIGAHPAFNVPLNAEGEFEDYYLHFSPRKSRLSIPLNGSHVDIANKTIGQTNTDIALTRELFSKDALVYETKGANSYSIRSEASVHSVTLSYESMPYLGIWSPYPKDAPFVCIEPWCGIADTVDASGNLEEKLGMNQLAAGEIFTTEYQIAID